MRFRNPTILLLAVFAVVVAGCASTSAIGHAEQGLKVAVGAVDPLVQTDYAQAAQCRENNVPTTPDCSKLEKMFPGTHELANKIRAAFPPTERAAYSGVAAARDAQKVLDAINVKAGATDAEKQSAAQAFQAALVDMATKVAIAIAYGSQAQAVILPWIASGGGK